MDYGNARVKMLYKRRDMRELRAVLEALEALELDGAPRQAIQGIGVLKMQVGRLHLCDMDAVGTAPLVLPPVTEYPTGPLQR